MKRLVFTVLILLFSVSSFAAEIIGPSELDLKEADLFFVDGVTTEEFADCVVDVYPEENAPQVLVLQTLNSKPVLYIKGRTKGNFVILLDVNIPGRYELVKKEISIGGGPEPPPDPIDPPPLPGSKWRVGIVYESSEIDNLSKEQQQIINSLKFRSMLRSKGHVLVPGGIVDKDKKGELTGELEAFLADSKGKELPRICLIPIDGGKVRGFDLPSSVDGVFELLGKGK